MKRAIRTALRREEYHTGRVSNARTDRQRLAALTQWLNAEAAHASPEQVRRAISTVENEINTMRAATAAERQGGTAK